MIIQADIAAANLAFDVAFRGKTEGIDEAMGELFARHRELGYAEGLEAAAIKSEWVKSEWIRVSALESDNPIFQASIQAAQIIIDAIRARDPAAVQMGLPDQP
jgi:flagellar biosynthesis/type III secretory pathway protein FliH